MNAAQCVCTADLSGCRCWRAATADDQLCDTCRTNPNCRRRRTEPTGSTR